MDQNNLFTTKKINEFADVSLGCVLKRFPTASKSGAEFKIIQIRDVDVERGICLEQLQSTSEFDISDDYLLKRNDLLMINRGSRYTAALFDSEDLAIADSNFFIIRIKSNQITPAFLVSILNLKSTQRRLRSISMGTGIKKINLDCLNMLRVSVPDLVTQAKIVELNQLTKKESTLLNDLRAKKELFAELVISKKMSINFGGFT